MKNVKSDAWLRKKPIITLWVKYMGFFKGLLTERRIRFLTLAITKFTSNQKFSPLFKKYITLEQVAGLLQFCAQNKLFAFKTVAITIGCRSQIFSAASPEYMQTPFRFVESNFHSFNVFYRNAFKNQHLQ